MAIRKRTAGSAKRVTNRPSRPRYQVFVSHATADKWIASTFCEKIDATGASTFRDDRDINGGDDIPESIRSQIKQSRELVVLLTPESVDRPWVLLEVGAAWALRRDYRIIPRAMSRDGRRDSRYNQGKEGNSDQRVRSVSERTAEASEEVMATVTKTYDVFISHASSDSHLAADIAEDLESVGLEPFHAGAMGPGTDVGDAIWEALAESRAVIAIVSPDVLPQAMGMVEIGAAVAWNKPIYVVMNGSASTKLPVALSSYPVYTVARLGEVIQQIRTGFEPLNESERGALAEVYRNLKTPADQLSQSPKALRELTATFNRTVRKQFSGERLLSELIRMRKKGELPRLGTRN
ncbi:MAG: toll/interleukin-1 receptor domain-containing protein [Planctomycetaceae bacterium]|nr:toll/interleukin-1 receptor domain-containing protein [Planctomycetaceae bacterium]